MELSRKKQIKRRQLPGFENGLDYINYNYQAQYNPYVGVNYNPNQWNLRINTKDFMPTLNPKTDMPVYTKFPIPGENKRRSYSDVNIPAILGFGADVYNQFQYNKTANDMITDAGTSSGNIGGIGYTRYNPVDVNAEVSEVQRSRDLNTLNSAAKGAAAGSTFGPIGAAIGGAVGLIGGIFGGHRRKKEAERRAKEAAVLAQNLTTNNRAAAQTEALQQDYALHAAEGKDEGVYTPNGIMPFQPNSLVAKGESILSNLNPTNPEEAEGNVVKHGSGTKDDVQANLKESDVVLGKDIDWRTGLSFKKEGLPYTMALEHINNKYENNGNDLSSLSKPTQRLQQEQVNRLKQPIVEKLKDLADQQKYQHDVTGYNQQFMAARGKDRTIPPMLPSASVQQMIDYLFAAGDRDVANGRLGDEQSYQHRKYVEESGKDLYNFGEKHKKDYKSLPKKATIFNTLNNQEYYQQYLDAQKKYPTVNDYINGEMNEYRKYWQNKKEQSENRMKSNRLFGEFENGKDYHTIPNALGALASIGQMIHAGSQEIKPSDSYASHKYVGKVSDILAGLNINEQPGLQQINKAARYADFGITHSGGMSGSQKQLSRLANANNMYTNYLKFLWDSQAQRNAYKAQYANALATIGAQEAQNRQNANQWDLDYYSRAHAAKLGGIQMGLRNLMDYANQWSADASKRYQFNKMYGLYAFDTYNNANKYR